MCQSFNVYGLVLPSGAPKPGKGSVLTTLSGIPSMRLTSEFGLGLPAGNIPPPTIGIASGVGVPGRNVYTPFDLLSDTPVSLSLVGRYSIPISRACRPFCIVTLSLRTPPSALIVKPPRNGPHAASWPSENELEVKLPTVD